MEEVVQPGEPTFTKVSAGKQKTEKNTAMAIVAYLIFFLPLLTDAKNDPFVRYHIKQGLGLFISGIIAWIFMMISVLGLILAIPLDIILVVLLILGILHALHGEEKPLPIIGEYAKKFNI